MPLVSMVQFLFMTGPFTTVAEVIAELPEPIETDRSVYEHPRSLLQEYDDILCKYEQLKKGDYSDVQVMDEQGRAVDAFTAAGALIQQEIMTRELERINSALCAPCGCTLCCVGPDDVMAQEFFEIPLQPDELDLFSVSRHENDESLKSSPYDDNELLCNGLPFYRIDGPGVFHWRTGWSLILPKGSLCPNLDGETGRCQVYEERPRVCRRPQMFPYLVEPVGKEQDEQEAFRIRESLLAIVDCPYVRDLQGEIAEYASASGLQLILKQNKA